MKPLCRLPWLLLTCTCILAVESRYEEVVRKLRPHFMLGVAAAPGDSWVEETKAQGAQWDVRYQYLAGGVNTPNNWKTWNRPAGAFAAHYLAESGKQGAIPCLTWYQMYQSLPCGAQGDEAQGNKRNVESPATMKSYFEDFALLMRKCGEFGKPVIVHVEPDLWGFFLLNPAFKPNTADQVRVMVKSSGFAEAAEFDDTAAGFGKALIALRDRHAPNVLLAWHASMWGRPDSKATAEFCRKTGPWDLVFTDPSDRDAAWKLAKNYHAQGAWWSEKDFERFREWSGELHRLTGLPLMAWQVPMGNTHMASCNNTEGHYMDNRPEYFLENYPANPHLAEFKAAGYIGLLFGGGAGGCTSVRDTMKDGITNPEPVKDNKGEKAVFADDDGGYLRLRGGEYYRKGVLPLLAAAKTAATAPSRPAALVPPPAPPPAPAIDERLVADWQTRLIRRIERCAREGRPLQGMVRIGEKLERRRLAGADERELRVDLNGNVMPLRWSWITASDRLSLAKSIASDDDAESQLALAVFLLHAGQGAAAEEALAKAALADAPAAAALREALKAAHVLP